MSETHLVWHGIFGGRPPSSVNRLEHIRCGIGSITITAYICLYILLTNNMDNIFGVCLCLCGNSVCIIMFGCVR